MNKRSQLIQLTSNTLVAVCIVSLFMVSTGLVFAEEPLCKTPAISVFNQNTFSADGNTHLQADSVELTEEDTSRFQGNVVIQQQNKRIETEQAIYTKENEKVNANGDVNFISPSIKIKSKSAQFDLKSDYAILHNAEYQSIKSRARGTAKKIEISDADVTQFSEATYTTCEKNNSDWLFSASNITLNNESRQGHASHVVLRFKDVPFFYFPYLRFPLGEERLSGLLFPTFGSSDEHGTEFKIPYYWNIHPQVDATITPWYMSKRGTLLDTELRYLSEKHQGTLNVEYLDNDKLLNKKRQRVRWLHQSTLAEGWQTDVEYNSVADNSHLTDFGDDLSSTSTTYLVRTGNVTYNSQDWLLNVKAEAPQIISGAETYKRLPQITLNSQFSSKDNAFNYALQSEAVRFDHIENKVIGDRLHIKPSLSYPWRSAAGFLIPKLSIDHTSYQLQQTISPTQATRTIPTLSINSGLFFERDTDIFSQPYLQTLEPQLFYVYTPFKDQSSLPVFDTSAYSFNVNQFFTDYRFNGVDRIGDDNRLTAAIATRFINQENGQEIFMARIGQIFYLADRKVQLPGINIDTLSRSNMIADAKAQLGSWNISSQLEWDPDAETQTVSSRHQMGYQHKNFNLDLAYRFQRGSLETREVNMNWNINSRWQLNAAHLYDLKDEHIIENLVGVNYESCCWGLRLSTKERYISSTETDKGVYLELILKGLGGFAITQ